MCTNDRIFMKMHAHMQVKHSNHGSFCCWKMSRELKTSKNRNYLTSLWKKKTYWEAILFHKTIFSIIIITDLIIMFFDWWRQQHCLSTITWKIIFKFWYEVPPHGILDKSIRWFDGWSCCISFLLICNSLWSLGLTSSTSHALSRWLSTGK